MNPVPSDSQSLPYDSANKNGPRLEVVSHEEVPPAYVERLKMYDCTCQVGMFVLY